MKVTQPNIKPISVIYMTTESEELVECHLALISIIVRKRVTYNILTNTLSC